MSEIKRVKMSPKDIVVLSRELRDAKRTYTTGHYSLYDYNSRTKYVAADCLVDWPDLSGVIIERTPSEIARIELNRAFPDLKRVGWQRSQVKLFDWRPPNAMVETYDGYGVHIDLTSAYWQIYRKLWLDVGFPAGYGSLDLRPVANRLHGHKKARNAVIGMAASRKTQMVVKGEVREFYKKNPYLSPCLWAAIMSVLNEVAHFALELGAIWVGTDGYIFPVGHSSNDVFFLDELDRLGFDYHFKYGSVHIRGWGSYSTPLKTTHIYKVGNKGGQVPFRNVALYDNLRPSRSILTYFIESEKHREIQQRRIKLSSFRERAADSRSPGHFRGTKEVGKQYSLPMRPNPQTSRIDTVDGT